MSVLCRSLFENTSYIVYNITSLYTEHCTLCDLSNAVMQDKGASNILVELTVPVLLNNFMITYCKVITKYAV